MTKRKKIRQALLALSIGDWLQIVGVLTAAVLVVIKVDKKLERLEGKFERLEVKVDNIDNRLQKLEDIVHLDLSWRYLYQGDSTKTHFRPFYHPETKTLEIMPIKHRKADTVRKP